MHTHEQLSAMQRFAEALTSISTWLHLPSGIAPFAGWRWFIDGDYLVLEPRAGVIQTRDMVALDMHRRTTDVEAMFRATPNPGVYLRCKLTAEQGSDPNNHREPGRDADGEPGNTSE